MKSKIKVSQLKNLHYIQKRANEATNKAIGGREGKPTVAAPPKDKFETDRNKPGMPVL